MANRIKTFAIAIACAGFFSTAGSVHAALIDNGGFTTDTASGLQWLDVTATQGQTAGSVLGGFGGFIADGWAYATKAEVCGLFGALGGLSSSCNNPGQTSGFFNVPGDAATLVGLLGSTNSGSFGMYDDGNPLATYGLGCVTATPSVKCTLPNTDAWLAYDNWNTGDSTVGSFLVRSVPIPAAAWLFGSALLGLGAIARRKKA